MVLAWALEVTPSGVRITPSTESGRETSSWIARHPIAAVGIVFLFGVAVSTGVWLFPGFGSEPMEGVESLAVLPFAALSDESADQWLAQGLHDQLITELARLSALDRVTSRTSVLRYEDGTSSIPEIARALDVDAVIEGSILAAPDRVRINVQLIAGATDEHLWAQDYERSREQALDLVKSVAQDIAQRIQLEVTPSETSRLESTRTVHPAAQEAYFRGRAYWNERTSEGHARAQEQFRRAFDLDPDYAAPYAGMASSFVLSPSPEDQRLAQEYARRALELDPDLAEAHTVLAYSRMVDEYAWDDAEEGFRTAIRLQPSYATARQWGAELHAALGRMDTALEWIRRARELDPFSPIIMWSEVRILYMAGRYDECLEASDELGREFPDFRPGSYGFPCLIGAGRYSELAELADAPDSIRAAVSSGDVERMWLWQAALLQGDDPRDWDDLTLLALLDRRAEFFERVDTIFEAGGFGIELPMLLSNPSYDELREDPRWEERVLRRVDLEDRR